MKTKLIAILTLAASLIAGYSQQLISSPVTEFLSKSNLICAGYGIYDTTTKEWGAGIGLGFKLNEYIVPTLRFDYIGHDVYVPSANVQLQVPINIGVNAEGLASVRLVLFTFSALATSFNNWNAGENGDPVGMFGIGGAVSFPKLTRSFLLLADYERWTGGPFNDNQVRFGVGWAF